MEIPESDWLKAGFFWAVLALVSALPWIGTSWAGMAARVLVCVAALVHVADALWAANYARRANLDPMRWALRALVLGYLSVRRLRQLASPDVHPV